MAYSQQQNSRLTSPPGLYPLRAGAEHAQHAVARVCLGLAEGLVGFCLLSVGWAFRPWLEQLREVLLGALIGVPISFFSLPCLLVILAEWILGLGLTREGLLLSPSPDLMRLLKDTERHVGGALPRSPG